jgi:hypothetical protein
LQKATVRVQGRRGADKAVDFLDSGKGGQVGDCVAAQGSSGAGYDLELFD